MDNNKITSNKLNINSKMMEKLAEREKFLAKKREAFKNNTGNIQNNVGNIQDTNPNYEMLKENEKPKKSYHKVLKNLLLGGLLFGAGVAVTSCWTNKKEQEPVPTTAIETEAPTQEYPIETEVAKSALNADNINELTQQIKSGYEEIGLNLSEEAIADTLIYMNLKDMSPEEVANTLAARGETYSREELQELQNNATIVSSDVTTHNTHSNQYASIDGFLLNETDKKINESIDNLTREVLSASTSKERKQEIYNLMEDFLVATKNPESINGGYIDVGNTKLSKNDLDYAMEFFVENVTWPSLSSYLNINHEKYLTAIEKETIEKEILLKSGQATKFNTIVDNCLDEYKPSTR